MVKPFRLIVRHLPVVALGLAAIAQPAIAAPRRTADRLAEARARIEKGDARGAAAVAADLARADPDNGRARFVLGLALFHSSDYTGALTAFRDARRAGHPPARGPLAINEGAALFALGRHREAMRAFDEAAAVDPSLGALAAVYAAHAAAAADQLDEARRYIARAEALGAADALEPSLASLRADLASRETAARAARARGLEGSARAALDQGRLSTALSQYEQAAAAAAQAELPAHERADLAYALGHARYRAGRYAVAARAFAQAAALAPADAEIQFMAALTDYRRDRLPDARRGFERSLALGLAGDSRASAESYADALAPGLRALGKGWRVLLEAGGGYDSNVSQLGAVATEAVSAEHAAHRASPVAAGTAQLRYGRSAGRRLFLNGGYLFQQIAYAEPALDPLSIQLHRLRVDTELEPLASLRMALGAGGELQYTGVRERHGFLRVFSLEPAVALDLGDHATTTASFTIDARGALSEEARPLAGRRWEVRLAQRLRATRAYAEVAVRHAREDVGQLNYDLGQLDPIWSGRYVIPYSNRSDGILFDSAARLGPFDLGLGAGYERIQYGDDTVLLVEMTGGLAPMDVERQRRDDRRFTTHASLVWWLGLHWALHLRYDFTVNRSTIRFSFDDKNFTKHAATAGLMFSL